MPDRTAGPELLDVVIADRRSQADDIISLELRSTDGSSLPAFDAGAHVDVYIGDDVVRQYSLCNDPRETHRYVLGILRDPASRGGSVAVHRDFKVGKTITIGAPRNNFHLLENVGKSILVAGGIGITPLLSMAHRLSALDRDFALHYCVRSDARLAFRDEVKAWQTDGRAFIHYDDGDPGQGFHLASSLMVPADDTHVYICGPTGFIDFVTNEAVAAKLDPSRIHVEHFSLAPSHSSDSFVVRTTSGLEVEIPPDRSIADVLIDHGVDVPLLCEQGVCGTCLTPVLDGIPDHRDSCQSDDEKASNEQMTLCCSRAKSKHLLIDI